MKTSRKFCTTLLLLLSLVLILTACSNSGDSSTPDGSISEPAGSSADVNLSQTSTQDTFANYLIQPKARVADSDDREWLPATEGIVAEGVAPGTIIEVQAQYCNLDPVAHNKVTFWIEMAENLEYVPGSTILYDADCPDGLPVESDELADNGIIIGNYAGYDPSNENAETLENGEKCGANAYVRFRIKTLALEGDSETTTGTLAVNASAQREGTDVATPARELLFITVQNDG